MNPQEIINALIALRDTFDKIIEKPSLRLLDQARSQVKTSNAAFKKNSAHQKKWGYEISQSDPLRFVSSSIHRMDMYVDVYCKVYWDGTVDPLPCEQDLKIRVWTRHAATMFRPDWDAVRVQQELERLKQANPNHGRLMSRWHFDRADTSGGGSTTAFHPQYHLQYGGKDEPDELSWHPGKVNMPRIPCPPMDLALACQLVAANFHWGQYTNIRQRREWRRPVKKVEQALLLKYYQDCLHAVGGDQCLIDML